jgi:hypothetical protein
MQRWKNLLPSLLIPQDMKKKEYWLPVGVGK